MPSDVRLARYAPSSVSLRRMGSYTVSLWAITLTVAPVAFAAPSAQAITRF